MTPSPLHPNGTIRHYHMAHLPLTAEVTAAIETHLRKVPIAG